MMTKWWCILMLAVTSAASADTVYKTVTSDGKVVYSNTYSPGDAAAKPAQITINPNGVTTADAATGGGGGQSVKSSCKKDAQRFCTQSGDGKPVFDCLLDHQQDVSDACYEAMKQQIASGDEKSGEQDEQGVQPKDDRTAATPGSPPGMQGCKQDVKRFCSNVQPGGGRIVNCLLDHENDISDVCYDALSKKMKKGQP